MFSGGNMRNFLLCITFLFLLTACNAEPVKPQSQKDFNDAMTSIAKTFKSGDTQAQKDGKKKEAAESRADLFTRMAKNTAFDGWICKVEDVRKPAMSKRDELQLIAKCDFFKLYNFVDTFDSALLPQQILSDSPLYSTLLNLKKGDSVKLSGSFQNKGDKIFETSLTEGGGIEEPEIAVVFTTIEPIK